MKKLAAVRKRDIAAISARTDPTIDFSEMSEILDWSGAEVGRFCRLTKRLTTDGPIAPAISRIVDL